MIITISGSTRNTGKTSLAVYLIKHLLPCCAVKFSIHKENPYGEGIFEEKNRDPHKDTGRMKDAGAEPVYWVRTERELLENRLKEVMKLLYDKRMTVIMEGNSILEYIKPACSIFVMNNTFNDFKTSAWKVLKKSNIILINGKPSLTIEKECKKYNKAGKIIFTEEKNMSYSYPLLLNFLLKSTSCRPERAGSHHYNKSGYRNKRRPESTST